METKQVVLVGSKKWGKPLPDGTQLIDLVYLDLTTLKGEFISVTKEEVLALGITSNLFVSQASGGKQPVVQLGFEIPVGERYARLVECKLVEGVIVDLTTVKGKR